MTGFWSVQESADGAARAVLVAVIGVPVVILYGVLETVATGLGIGFGRLWLYLAGAGWPAGCLLGLGSGIALARRPIGRPVAGVLSLAGAGVALLGVVALASGIVWDGLERLPQSLILATFGNIGIAVLMGLVALIVGRSAGRTGDPAPTLPVLGLVVSAGLIGLSNTMQALVGGLGDVLGPGERIAVGFSSFGLASGVLLLAAAVVVVLAPGAVGLRPVVVAASVAVIVLGLIGAGLFAVVGDSGFARGRILGIGVGNPFPAVGAVALLSLIGPGDWVRTEVST